MPVCVYRHGVCSDRLGVRWRRRIEGVEAVETSSTRPPPPKALRAARWRRIASTSTLAPALISAPHHTRPLRFDFSPFFLLSGLPGGLLALLGALGGLFGALGGLFGACLGEAVFGLPGGLLSTMALMVRGARRQVCEAALVPCGLARWACRLVALV